MQDGVTNCANTMPDTCGGFRGQIGFACRTSTLSVAVTPETNVSEVNCYNANHANIDDTWEPLGNASMQLMPASKPSLFLEGLEGVGTVKLVRNPKVVHDDLNRNVYTIE